MDGVMVNTVNFLHGTDETVKCCHTTHMSRTQAEDHCEALDDVLHKHNKARFVVTVIHCDQEFKPLMDKVEDNLSVRMSCTNPGNHQPTTEHDKRTLKGGVQTQHSLLPHRNIPKVMVKSWCFNHARN